MLVVNFLLFNWDVWRIEYNYLRLGLKIIRGEGEIVESGCGYLLDAEVVFIEVALRKERSVHAEIDADMQQWRPSCFFQPIVQIC